MRYCSGTVDDGCFGAAEGYVSIELGKHTLFLDSVRRIRGQGKVLLT